MNSTEKELKGYIGGTEKMSGFDSDLEGDMSYFDDEDSDYFDDDAMSMASGARAVTATSEPYVISYENTTAGDLTAVIFGYNDYFGSANYGNPVGIVIVNLQGGTYGRLIAQSNNKFFKIGKWRFQCSNASQLQQTLTINHVDANGDQYSKPMNLSIARDAYQQQADILDLSRPVTIDGNSFITFPLKALTTFTISMFPVAILSGKAKLNGGSFDNKARAPKLSGKNASNVIIQTTQDVRGITGR